MRCAAHARRGAFVIPRSAEPHRTACAIGKPERRTDFFDELRCGGGRKQNAPDIDVLASERIAIADRAKRSVSFDFLE
jgi:hypothetical protein